MMYGIRKKLSPCRSSPASNNTFCASCQEQKENTPLLTYPFCDLSHLLHSQTGRKTGPWNAPATPVQRPRMHPPLPCWQIAHPWPRSSPAAAPFPSAWGNRHQSEVLGTRTDSLAPWDAQFVTDPLPTTVDCSLTICLSLKHP